MFISILFSILLFLCISLVITFYSLKKKGKISTSGKTTAIELISLFASLGSILSFVFVLTSHYIQSKENTQKQLKHENLIVSDFISSMNHNINSLVFFMNTKAVGHDPDKSNIIEYSQFISTLKIGIEYC